MNSLTLKNLRLRANKLGKSSFVRNVAAVATGIAAAQAISLAFMPFLTRLYGPEAFGALAAFTAIVNIIGPIATLGYANAIVMPQNEEGAIAVARLSLVCAAVTTPLALLVVGLFQTPLASLTGMEATPGLLFLLPLSLLLGALMSVANQAAIREGVFKAKAGSFVASTLLTNINKLIGGLLAPLGLVLIALTILARALNFVMLLARVPRKGALDVTRWFGVGGIRKAAVEQRDFVLYRMPQSIINGAALGLPVILLTSFFGAASAGQYSLAVTALAAPVVLLGQAVGEVFYPKITRAISSDARHALSLLLRGTMALAAAAVIPFGLVFFWGSDLFTLVFGVEWSTAGEYATWLSLWLGFTLASRACLSSLPGLKMQSYLLFQEVLSMVLRIGALQIGFYYFQSDVVAIALFSLAGVLLNVLLIAVTIASMALKAKRQALGSREA